jgi:hypothetical protein
LNIVNLGERVQLQIVQAGKEHPMAKLPSEPNWKLACHCAISDGIPRRSFYVAIVVGTVLNLINQGDAFIGSASINWLKIILTYFVPYAVCTYGAVSSQMRLRFVSER